MVNVGKYTSPMDPMGKDVPIISKYEGGFTDPKKTSPKSGGVNLHASCGGWLHHSWQTTRFLPKKPSLGNPRPNQTIPDWEGEFD